MKKWITGVILLMGIFTSASANDHELVLYAGNRIDSVDDVRIRFRDECVTITPKDRFWNERVEITKNHDLYINGKRIRLNGHERRMVGDYYRLTDDILWQAKRVGQKGARIGAEGAKLGLTAVVNLVKLLDSDYTTEHYERDIEKKAKAIERKSEDLEEEAEEIEDMADDLKRLHRSMRRKIDELNRLRWF